MKWNGLFGAALVFLFAAGCAAPQRPTLAASWCANETDRDCSERYNAIYEHSDLYGADDGNREGMVTWYAYRCSFDPASIEAADSSNEFGLECFRAGQLELRAGRVALAQRDYERGCEEVSYPDACDAAAEFEREKVDLKAAHELLCRGKRGSEERQENLPRYDHLDCDAGSDSHQRLREAEMAKLGRPAPPPNLVECAIHGCTVSDGRFIKRWIVDWK